MRDSAVILHVYFELYFSTRSAWKSEQGFHAGITSGEEKIREFILDWENELLITTRRHSSKAIYKKNRCSNHWKCVATVLLKIYTTGTHGCDYSTFAHITVPHARQNRTIIGGQEVLHYWIYLFRISPKTSTSTKLVCPIRPSKNTHARTHTQITQYTILSSTRKPIFDRICLPIKILFY
jgi:hypothetical protein